MIGVRGMETGSQGEQDVMMEAEMRMTLLQVKEQECLQLLASRQEAGRGTGDRFSLTASDGIVPANTSISNVKHLELRDNTFLLLKSPSLWCFLREALAD